MVPIQASAGTIQSKFKRLVMEYEKARDKSMSRAIVMVHNL